MIINNLAGLPLAREGMENRLREIGKELEESYYRPIGESSMRQHYVADYMLVESLRRIAEVEYYLAHLIAPIIEYYERLPKTYT